MTEPESLEHGLIVANYGRHFLVEAATGERVICHSRGKKSQGVVGDRLISAFEQAKRGDVAALMNGDEALGRIVLDRLTAQMEIWKFFFADLPVFVVNGTIGRDITQDLLWYASEHSAFLKPGKEKTAAEFRELMKKTYNVDYDAAGNWVPSSAVD